MNTETPGKRLSAWRAGRGLSLKKAGKLFGVSAPTVLSYESNTKRPRGARRNLIEAVTGIPADAWATPAERALDARARAAQGDPPREPSPPPSARAKKAAAPARKPGPQKATRRAPADLTRKAAA